MSDSYETEVVRKVYDNDHGEAITISPSPDFPGNVVLYVEDKHVEYFGRTRLDLPAEFMRKIAKALLEACTEADSKE